MINKSVILIKTIIKSSLDSYVLPGTRTGTEILLIYLLEWKREMSLLALASFYILKSQYDSVIVEKLNRFVRERS